MPHEFLTTNETDSGSTEGDRSRDTFADRFARELGINTVAEGSQPRTQAPVHEHERIGVPAGRTLFDFEEGEAIHKDTGNKITDIPKVSEISQVGRNTETKKDKSVLRSIVAFGDVGVQLEVNGRKIPIDPCQWHPLRAIEHTSFIVHASIPTDLYILPSSRAEPAVDPSLGAIHMDRVGPTFSGTADNWSTLGFQTITQADDPDFGAAERVGKLHVQNYKFRTFTIENTGANDFEVRVLGNVTHAGYGRFTSVDPNNQPVTVAAGSTEIITVNQEAWHLFKLQIKKLDAAAAGTNLDAAYEFGGVSA